MKAGSDAAKAAAQCLAAGGLVAFPTETVYGVGADATNAHAVARLYAAKGRPSFNPLIAHVAGLAEARQLARFDATATQLAPSMYFNFSLNNAMRSWWVSKASDIALVPDATQ